MAVDGIGSLSAVNSLLTNQDTKVESTDLGSTFADYFKDALNKTNDLQVESQNITNEFAAGKTDNIQQVMVAAEKADVALQFTLQIRNKILDAYNEINRMPI